MWFSRKPKHITPDGIALPARYAKLTWRQRQKVRDEYVRIQGGRCWYCDNPLTENPTPDIQSARISWRKFPEGFRKHPVHLHHSHLSGKTIGAVHMRCNAYLWHYESR